MNMKRREFNRIAAGAALASSGMMASLAWSQAKSLQAGVDYLVLEPRASVDAPAGKIEVVEFFSYNCPHCNAFEPALEAWIKKLPKDVVMRRVPVAFQDSYVPQQRLYFALEGMGLVEKLHTKVFSAVHVEKIKLDKGEAIIDWIVSQGVDKVKFTDQYNSFSVATKATRGTQLQNAYKVEGVPALGVAGRFYTDGSIAKGMERALRVVDALIADVRAKR